MRPLPRSCPGSKSGRRGAAPPSVLGSESPPPTKPTLLASAVCTPARTLFTTRCVLPSPPNSAVGPLGPLCPTPAPPIPGTSQNAVYHQVEEAQSRFRLVNVTAQQKQLSHQYNLALERGDTGTYPAPTPRPALPARTPRPFAAPPDRGLLHSLGTDSPTPPRACTAEKVKARLDYLERRKEEEEERGEHAHSFAAAMARRAEVGWTLAVAV